jgi:hypothetical protein
VDSHVAEDYIRVGYSSWKPQMAGHCQREMEQDIVKTSVPLPILAIQIVVVILRIRTMEMGKIAAEHACQQYNTCERRKGRDPFPSHNAAETESTLGLALDK